jgi:hypothetical protein
MHGIVEGTMKKQQSIDAQFDAFQHRLLVDFATQFDAWAERATTKRGPARPGRFTLGNLVSA